ncbi:MAG TPA: DNA primase [Leptospiraceae bacterium]|nr:DNA primase [Leptospiraceae bacterium]HMW07748.1 DNA primase [Leptospiraceae bacterium]HMX31982.1 DNA primase [Leptospiraceae bacterium]HMY33414.1 DNA primase [Leptospiraceae bacterium]HMZ64778.1 DNA primase [Leptospiraceae bacterium]
MSTQEFEIHKLIELARTKKYELAVAGFAALDKIDRVPVPKKLKTRKIAVQALYALSDGLVKYDYFTAEQRKKLQAEANMSDAPYKGFKGLFSNSAAPVVEEDIEEDYIPQEEEAKHDFVAEGDSDELDSASDDEDDNDDDDLDDEDDDDLDDDDDDLDDEDD